MFENNPAIQETTFQGKRYVNLTGKDILLYNAKGIGVIDFPASGGVVRLVKPVKKTKEFESVSDPSKTRLVRYYGDLAKKLPPVEDGLVLILEEAPAEFAWNLGRTDVVTPSYYEVFKWYLCPGFEEEPVTGFRVS